MLAKGPTAEREASSPAMPPAMSPAFDAPANAGAGAGADDWPLQGWVDDMRPALARARRPCALATLCATEGPTPRPVGAQMLVGEEVVGHLSGGCVEGDVALHGRACIADGRPRRLIYGRGGPWPDIRLACGGRLEVLVERIAPGDLAVVELLRLSAARLPATLSSDGVVRRAAPARDALPAPAGGYTRTFTPAPRLVVVGRDPTALAMCALGLQSGLEVALVAPRGPGAAPPLPGLRYLRSGPADALQEIGLDPWTAVAVATHDSEDDEAALTAALPSQAGYVGVLGARSRLARQRIDLEARGLGEAVLDRLHAPIGLPGYGKAPRLVAVAAIAEILQVLPAG